jgi:hypothetical protein
MVAPVALRRGDATGGHCCASAGEDCSFVKESSFSVEKEAKRLFLVPWTRRGASKCTVAIARLFPGPGNEKKFFGSFFQERTTFPSLPLALPTKHPFCPLILKN